MAVSSFAGAPVTKVLLLGTASFTLLSQLPTRALTIDYLGVKEVLRLVFCYSTYREMFIGCFLLYTFRVLERYWGSNKFISYVLISTGMAFAVQVVLYSTTASTAFRFHRAGPIALIFSLLLRFYSDVPSVAHSRGQRPLIGEKLFPYVAAWLLLFDWHSSQFTSSWVQAALGLLSGLVATSKVLPFHKLAFPMAVVKLANKYLAPLVASSPPPPATPANVMARLQSREGEGMYSEQLLPTFGDIRAGRWQPERQYHEGPPQPNLPAAHVTEENIQALVNMDFPRDRAITALQHNGNQVEAAVGWLVSNS